MAIGAAVHIVIAAQQAPDRNDGIVRNAAFEEKAKHRETRGSAKIIF